MIDVNDAIPEVTIWGLVGTCGIILRDTLLWEWIRSLLVS